MDNELLLVSGPAIAPHGRQAGRSDHNAVRHWDVSSVRPAFRYEITKIAPRALFPQPFACRGTLSRRTSGAVTESHCNGNAGLSIGKQAPRETKRGFSFSSFSPLPPPFSLIQGRNTRFYPSISRSCAGGAITGCIIWGSNCRLRWRFQHGLRLLVDNFLKSTRLNWMDIDENKLVINFIIDINVHWEKSFWYLKL